MVISRFNSHTRLLRRFLLIVFAVPPVVTTLPLRAFAAWNDSDAVDAILMDVQMPRMDGCEAARQVRALADPAKAGLPIVAVTANAFEEDRKPPLEAGMNSQLAKPYDISVMMETLDRLLSQEE